MIELTTAQKLGIEAAVQSLAMAKKRAEDEARRLNQILMSYNAVVQDAQQRFNALIAALIEESGEDVDPSRVTVELDDDAQLTGRLIWERAHASADVG